MRGAFSEVQGRGAFSEVQGRFGFSEVQGRGAFSEVQGNLLCEQSSDGNSQRVLDILH